MSVPKFCPARSNQVVFSFGCGNDLHDRTLLSLFLQPLSAPVTQDPRPKAGRNDFMARLLLRRPQSMTAISSRYGKCMNNMVSSGISPSAAAGWSVKGYIGSKKSEWWNTTPIVRKRPTRCTLMSRTSFPPFIPAESQNSTRTLPRRPRVWPRRRNGRNRRP